MPQVVDLGGARSSRASCTNYLNHSTLILDDCASQKVELGSVWEASLHGSLAAPHCNRHAGERCDSSSSALDERLQ